MPAARTAPPLRRGELLTIPAPQARIDAADVVRIGRAYLEAESPAQLAAQLRAPRAMIRDALFVLGRAAATELTAMGSAARVQRATLWSVRSFSGRWAAGEPLAAEQSEVGAWTVHVAVTNFGLVDLSLERGAETTSSALWRACAARWPHARILDGARLRRDGSAAEKRGFEDEAVAEWVLGEVLGEHLSPRTLAAGLALRASLHNCVEEREDDAPAPAARLGLVSCGWGREKVLRALAGGTRLCGVSAAPPPGPGARIAPRIATNGGRRDARADSGRTGWEREAARLRAERVAPEHRGYPAEWKRQAVAVTIAAVREGVRRKIVARALGIDHCTLGDWLKKFAPDVLRQLPVLELSQLAVPAAAPRQIADAANLTAGGLASPEELANEVIELPGGARVTLGTLRRLRRERLLAAVATLSEWAAYALARMKRAPRRGRGTETPAAGTKTNGAQPAPSADREVPLQRGQLLFRW